MSERHCSVCGADRVTAPCGHPENLSDEYRRMPKEALAAIGRGEHVAFTPADVTPEMRERYEVFLKAFGEGEPIKIETCEAVGIVEQRDEAERLLLAMVQRDPRGGDGECWHCERYPADESGHEPSCHWTTARRYLRARNLLPKETP